MTAAQPCLCPGHSPLRPRPRHRTAGPVPCAVLGERRQKGKPEQRSACIPSSTPKGTCLESVKIAIDTGYRHIDGAFVYFNEHEVGQAIREKIAEGRIKREDIFYCGKVRIALSLFILNPRFL
ncbi:PREDICTED: aldo-keto reductase family 1 member C23-like [Tinamus guttatus]|uniref:aldo-keto reductase family 1 member C23-like n=1 Tax=Tinamus guttatus TaxID=94827 RepID=UPI00052F1107|nr:PREDICTED: aldo-keto reductase family 1 member C23-like [Tinamus guttatus]